MKTQLATLLLVFAHHGAAAHNVRGNPHRNLKKSGRSAGKKDSNEAYRVVGGKKGFNDGKSSYSISFEPDPAILWLVIDKNDDKTGKCVSAISEWALENYRMDLAVVEKEPKSDRLAPDDIIVFVDKNTKADDCEDLANEIANSPGFSERTRGGIFDDGEQNIAVFDVNPEDKKCESDCRKDKKDCEDNATTDQQRAACRDAEKDCKDDCEEDCEDDCDKWWDGPFNEACRRAC